MSRPALRSFFLYSGAIIGTFAAGRTSHSLFPTSTPVHAPPQNDDDEKHERFLRSKAETLPYVQTFRSPQESPDLKENRITLINQANVKHNLTAGSLKGKDKIGMAPLLFAHVDGKKMYGVVHVGRSLCGHDGIVHGGFLATLFDESLAYVAFSNLPDRIGFTANLNVNYRRPVPADGFYVVTVEHVKTEGRKCWVKATLSDSISSDATVYADAQALFIGPKSSALLQQKLFRAFSMGP